MLKRHEDVAIILKCALSWCSGRSSKDGLTRVDVLNLIAAACAAIVLSEKLANTLS